MRSPRIAESWRFLPLITWVAIAAVVAVLLWQSGGFRSDADARALYDSGTRAAMTGDLPRAVLDLRAAQRVTPGLLPSHDSLAARIDGNLAEVRARVAARADAGSQNDAGERVQTPAASSSVMNISAERAAGDRALALVRSVPLAARVYLAAALLGLLIALAAMRQFNSAAGRAVSPGAAPVLMAIAATIAAAAFAGADLLFDARHAEAVLTRTEVPRTGPDDLTYPPAAAAAFPAGFEVLVLGQSEDGRWVRVSKRNAPQMSSQSAETALWLPRSATERIGPDPFAMN